MRLDGALNHAALIALGAERVEDVHADGGDIIGVEVTPDVDASGYDAAVARVTAPPVPYIISDRQFAQQAAIAGMITQDDALAWVGPGTIPPTLVALVEALPEAVRFGAKMLLSGATTFDRTHPLTAQLASAFGWTDAQRDSFWTAAAAL